MCVLNSLKPLHLSHIHTHTYPHPFIIPIHHYNIIHHTSYTIPRTYTPRTYTPRTYTPHTFHVHTHHTHTTTHHIGNPNMFGFQVILLLTYTHMCTQHTKKERERESMCVKSSANSEECLCNSIYIIKYIVGRPCFYLATENSSGECMQGGVSLYAPLVQIPRHNSCSHERKHRRRLITRRRSYHPFSFVSFITTSKRKRVP
jgi:hypothetical protein